MTSPQRPRAAATPTAPVGMRDDPELPNKVLFDNQARAYKADGASGIMNMDSSVALAMIAEIMRSRSAPTPDLATAPEGVTAERSDLIERLQMLISLNEPRHGGPYQGAAAEACVQAMRDAKSALAAQAQRRDEVVEECATLAYAAAFTWTFNRWHDEQAAIESAEAVREHIEINTAQQEPK